ncbi:hypothetical protein O1611_g10161 [Lasiodiplodia mahajangana]|uniref:Uncharacterized protein n=1 Tax=Lasiodiplodia mahajangana TaxID=1108764 RepID=A0ACC2J152_9PEZI|nr:hypothetical protein O1611_g10161 [Lasiodiplodia mahajangana]
MRRFTPEEPGIGARGYHAVPLFDSGSTGGSGQLLDAVAVKAALEQDRELRIVLAGGLTPENVAEVIQGAGEGAQRIIGVDVSSGVEGPDGLQSIERIRDFIKAAKAIR